MSTDTFEDDLRCLLRDTADAEGPAYVDVDPNAVVTAGRRVVRRRRLGAGAGIAALTVTVGLVGISTLGTGDDRTSPPAGSASASASPVDALLTRDADVGDPWGPADGHSGARVTLDRSTGQLTFVSFRDGEPRPFGMARMPIAPRAAAWVTSDGTPGLVIGIVPKSATDISFLWTGDAPASTHSVAVLPGTGYQAFAIWHDGAKSDTTFAGFDWFDGTQVFDSRGRPVPSGRSGDSVAFFDLRGGLFGIFSPNGSMTKRVNDTPTGKLPGLMDAQVPDGSATMDITVLALLPAGASNVDVTPSPGATVQSVDTVPGENSQQQTMVIVRLREPDMSPGAGVEQVRWTNADGTPGSGTLG